MNHKKYLLTIALTAALSWLAWGIVVTKLDPFESTSLALSLFFLSLTFALIGSFTLLGFGLRRWLSKEELHEQHLSVSLRQGVLLSLCTIFCLAFLIVGVLKWWNGLLLVTIAVLVEMFLTSRS
jgi:hypothetical protein